MKHVGEAVRHMKVVGGAASDINVLGVATWGIVDRSADLISEVCLVRQKNELNSIFNIKFSYSMLRVWEEIRGQISQITIKLFRRNYMQYHVWDALDNDPKFSIIRESTKQSWLSLIENEGELSDCFSINLWKKSKFMYFLGRLWIADRLKIEIGVCSHFLVAILNKLSSVTSYVIMQNWRLLYLLSLQGYLNVSRFFVY